MDPVDEATKLLVLWDVDHTLVDSAKMAKEICAAAFEKLSGQTLTYWFNPDGKTDPLIAEELFRHHNLPFQSQLVDITAAFAAGFAMNADRWQLRAKPMPGASAAIRALSTELYVIQTVLTGNVRPNAVSKLSAFGLEKGLDFTVGGYGSDDAIRANLVAIAQKRAMAKYGTNFHRENTIIIGDTPRDIQAGKQGGARVIAVASGIYSEQTLEAEGADIVLPDLRDTSAIQQAILALSSNKFLIPD